MFYTLSLLAGALIAVMVAINGALSGLYDLHWVTVFLHFTGLLFVGGLVLLKRENPFSVRHPWFFYLGGAFGVINTIFNNFAFGRIRISAIFSLVLLGQSISGLIVDHYGLWGMPQRSFHRRTLPGIALMLIGVSFMLTDFEIVAVLLSFLTGVTVLLNRTFNAKLSDVSNVRISTFFNYFVGLLFSLPIFFIFATGEASFLSFRPANDWFLYIGGFIGVFVIMLNNIVALKIPAFYLTLLIFIGQVFTGILIDALLAGAFSLPIFLGGLFISAGLCANLLSDRRSSEC